MKRIEGRDAGRLTRRERILLGVLGILLLWTCVLRLAIAPAQRRLDEASLALGEERTRRAACAEWLKMAWENRAELEETEKFFFQGLTRASIETELLGFARACGVDISRMELGEPIQRTEGIFEIHVSAELDGESVEKLCHLAREIDGQEKSVFLTDFLAEAGEDGKAEGKMEVVYCYEMDEQNGITGILND